MSSLANLYVTPLAAGACILVCQIQSNDRLLTHWPTPRMQRTAFHSAIGQSFFYVWGLNLQMWNSKGHFPSKEKSQATSHCTAFILTSDRNVASHNETKVCLLALRLNLMHQYDRELVIVDPVGEPDIFLEHIPELRKGFFLSQQQLVGNWYLQWYTGIGFTQFNF